MCQKRKKPPRWTANPFWLWLNFWMGDICIWCLVTFLRVVKWSFDFIIRHTEEVSWRHLWKRVGGRWFLDIILTPNLLFDTRKSSVFQAPANPSDGSAS